MEKANYLTRAPLATLWGKVVKEKEKTQQLRLFCLYQGSYIGIRKVISKVLPSPFSECTDMRSQHKSILHQEFFKRNKTYQQEVCFEMCKQTRVVEECGCGWSGYPQIFDYDSCINFDDIRCALNVSRFMHIKPAECADLC
jgi:hypothetical protein